MSMRPPFTRPSLAIIGLAVCAVLAGCGNKEEAKPVPATPDAANETPALSIPLQRDGHWIVAAQDTDHKSHRVLLDTGASFNVLENQGSLAAAPLTADAEAALLRQGVLTSPVADADVTIDTTSDPRQLKLGLTPALTVQGWSMPAGALALRGGMGRIASAGDASFDGIIGTDMMRSLTWRADYVAGRLTAYQKEAPSHDWQQCTFMALDARTRVPFVELGFGDSATFVVLDTGYDGEVMLPQEPFDNLAKSHAFLQTGTTPTIGMANRVVERRQGLLAGLSIGQKPLPKLVVAEATTDARIGMGLLEKMDRFELDFRHYRFCFDLPSTPRDSALAAPRSALLRSGDTYEIVTLAPGDRMARSGGQPGDKIAMVDQTSVATLDLARVTELLGAATTTQVTVQRGRRTLVLKLKPV